MNSATVRGGIFLLAVVSGGAFGQAYECRTKDGNIVLQPGVPCAEKAEEMTYTWYWRCADRSRGSNAVVFRKGVVAAIRTSCS